MHHWRQQKVITMIIEITIPTVPYPCILAHVTL